MGRPEVAVLFCFICVHFTVQQQQPRGKQRTRLCGGYKKRDNYQIVILLLRQ